MHSVETLDNLVLVHIGEDLNNPRSNMAFNQFLKDILVQHEPALLALDFSDVHFIDSSGIKELILVHRAQQNRGAGMACLGLSSALLELFQMVRLDRIFRIYESRQELLEAQKGS